MEERSHESMRRASEYIQLVHNMPVADVSKLLSNVAASVYTVTNDIGRVFEAICYGDSSAGTMPDREFADRRTKELQQNLLVIAAYANTLRDLYDLEMIPKMRGLGVQSENS